MNRVCKWLLGPAAFVTAAWMSTSQERPQQIVGETVAGCTVDHRGTDVAKYNLEFTNVNTRFRLTSGAAVRLPDVQGCSQRVGPFAGQDAAWRRWREAQAAGYSVSSGIFKCYDGELGEGWCFNVFYPC